MFFLEEIEDDENRNELFIFTYEEEVQWNYTYSFIET